MADSVIRMLVIFLCLCCLACKKAEEVDLPWQQENLPPLTDRLQAIQFINDSTAHIVGGQGFSSGVHLSTYDGGNSWQVEVPTNFIAYDFHFKPNDHGFLVGINRLLQKNGRTEPWFERPLIPIPERTVPPLNAIDFSEEELVIMVGGVSFKNGVIYRMNEAEEIVDYQTFENELSDVTFVDNQVAMAVGYGIVLRTIDGGNHWEQLPIFDDFFRSIHFPTAEVGYMVGFSGSILKTEDAGATWTFQRKGSKLTISDEPFRDVFFVDEMKGFIVGDNGTFWLTTDGGAHWKSVANLPDINFYGLHIWKDKGYIVGENGTLISFLVE